MGKRLTSGRTPTTLGPVSMAGAPLPMGVGSPRAMSQRAMAPHLLARTEEAMPRHACEPTKGALPEKAPTPMAAVIASMTMPRLPAEPEAPPEAEAAVPAAPPRSWGSRG